MFHLTVRIQDPKQEEIKYLTNRLSADIGAKQILPTLFLIGRDEDSNGNEINAKSIHELMLSIDDKVDDKCQWVVSRVYEDAEEYHIEYGLNDNTIIDKVWEEVHLG